MNIAHLDVRLRAAWQCALRNGGVRLSGRHWFSLFACAILTGAVSARAAPVLTPLGDVPGSETVGDGRQGSATGQEIDYYGFDSSQFTQLYYGINPNPPSDIYLPNVNLDGVDTTLVFQEVDGTTAMWTGSTVADLSGDGPMTIPLRFLMTITGLGDNPWVDPASVSLPLAMGAAVADPEGLDFKLNFFFQADYGDGFGPLVPAPFGSQGGTVGSSVGYTFFVVRPTPEPATLVMAMMGGFGLVLAVRPRHQV